MPATKPPWCYPASTWSTESWFRRDARPRFTVNAYSLDKIRSASQPCEGLGHLCPATPVREPCLPRPAGAALRVVVFELPTPTYASGLLLLHGAEMVMKRLITTRHFVATFREHPTTRWSPLTTDWRQKNSCPAELADRYAAPRRLQEVAEERVADVGSLCNTPALRCRPLLRATPGIAVNAKPIEHRRTQPRASLQRAARCRGDWRTLDRSRARQGQTLRTGAVGDLSINPDG
jgi:hypothetical protein